MQYVDEGPRTERSQEALQYTNTALTARVTKLYVDYLTNNYTGAPTGASNMEDPRADTLIPRAMNKDGVWFRSQGGYGFRPAENRPRCKGFYIYPVT